MSESQLTGSSEPLAAEESAAVTTGMGTGSDAGAPGDHLAPEPLDEGDQDLLGRLRDDDSAQVVEPVEDGAAAAQAADADSVLPLGGDPAPPDEDTPQFLAPE